MDRAKGQNEEDERSEAGTFDAEELADRLARGEPVRILDVRDRDAMEAWRIEGPSVTLTQVPSSKFLQAEVTGSVADLATDIDGEGPITVVCAEGDASGYVAALLTEAGYPACNLSDGMEGWARVYRATDIATDPTVRQYHRPSSGCLAYMVIDGDAAAVIDPLRAFTDRYLADAADIGADILAVIDTHVHADHVSGLRDLATAAAASAYLPTESVDRGIEFDVESVADGEAVAVGDTVLRALALPGHTTDMTGFRVEGILLSGDSVFLDGVARPDLQVAGADAERDLAQALYETLTERFAGLDQGTVVGPGHASEDAASGDRPLTASLGDLRTRLAAFDTDRKDFVEQLTADLPPPPANADRIVAINTGAEAADADTAFELELGPNNCAAGTWD